MLRLAAKRFACGAIAKTGVPRLLQACFFPNKLTIVTYHGIVRTPLKIYDWCFLTKNHFANNWGYHQEALRRRLAFCGRRSSGAGKLKSSSTVITLDDGYQNNYSVAFPVLREFALPATVFIATGFINTDDTSGLYGLISPWPIQNGRPCPGTAKTQT